MTGRFLAVAFAMLLTACATPATVKTDFDPKAPFGSYRSFSWITPPAGPLGRK